MTNILLYIATVLVWGFSWYGIKLQLGVVPPEVSVAYRFMLAAAIMFAWAFAARERLRVPLKMHAALALLGLFLFSGNYLQIYYGSRYLPSGLVSVVFSVIVVLNIVNARILLGQRASGWVWAGALLGLSGIAIVFWRDIIAFDLTNASTVGLLFCLGSTFSASLGNVLATRLHSELTVMQANAWGMSYGVLFLVLFITLRGVPFTFDPSPAYIGGLLYLAVFASVLGFTFYLTLMSRIGPDRAAYSSVLYPVVALTVSAVLEDFRFTGATILGGLVILAGNVLVLARPQTLNRLILRRPGSPRGVFTNRGCDRT